LIFKPGFRGGADRIITGIILKNAFNLHFSRKIYFSYEKAGKISDLTFFHPDLNLVKHQQFVALARLSALKAIHRVEKQRPSLKSTI